MNYKKNFLLFSIWFIIILGILLIYKLPAPYLYQKFIADKLPANIYLQNIQGNILTSQAVLVVNHQPLKISWQIELWSLLLAKKEVNVQIENNSNRAHFELFIEDNIVSIKVDSLLFRITELLKIFAQKNLAIVNGIVTTQGLNFKIDLDTLFLHGQQENMGTINITNVDLFDAKDTKIVITPTTIKGNLNINADVAENNWVANANLTLDKNKKYTINGTIKASKPSEIPNWAAFISKANGKSIPFKYSGTLN